ncbi:hypothetical protein [Paeniglutamicibacter gangotriensis]|uniref:hypothetical protein n=1 Tax=Paeniglutamicibacter gangotriensis TaxID=254787 RepID=UPI003743A6AA
MSYGEYSVSATQAKDGQNSKAAKSSFKIQLAAPAITTPADGNTFTGVQSEIAGTGVAGATVKLSGSVTENVKVGADGKWSVVLDEALSYGSHSITAVQTSGETTSTSEKTAFKVSLLHRRSTRRKTARSSRSIRPRRPSVASASTVPPSR